MPDIAHYFPVSVRHAIPGPGYRLGDRRAGSTHIEIDSRYQDYVQQTGAEPGVWESDRSRSRLEARIRDWLHGIIQHEQPGLVDASQSLDDMVDLIQEDLVVMRRAAGADAVHARAVYLNVRYPSGWCPSCATGMSFVRIHAPVPNVNGFGGAARKQAAAALFCGNTRVRFVWTVVPDDQLDRRRCQRSEQTGHASHRFAWHNTEQLRLRVERQVICPLDESTSVFLIRLYHYPVAMLTGLERASLCAALESMPASLRRYKGLPADLHRAISA